MKSKNWFGFFLGLVVLFFAGCSSEESPEPKEEEKKEEPITLYEEMEQLLDRLWKTSLFRPSGERVIVFNEIQEYADLCKASYFKDYYSVNDNVAKVQEETVPILALYKISFDKVLQEVKETPVENGTVCIWFLYNMGMVIKTPSGCFAIDIYHRYAKLLEPYIDFLCITHNHVDHYDKQLIEAMFAANKPVLSNYLKNGENYEYTSTKPAYYKIGEFAITTNITDHNSTLIDFVTTFQINCGKDTNSFVFMHIGDSNFQPKQYTIVETPDVMVTRYCPAGGNENRIIGAITNPSYVLLEHILEMGHDGVENSRWPLNMGLERCEYINNDHTYMPFWGEKLVWKDNQLFSSN